MSSLRKLIKSPYPWLFITFLIIFLVIMDSLRTPEKQISAKFYLQFVCIYQKRISPYLEGHVRCRYIPTCSEYSIIAVQRFGIRKGLFLSIKRVLSCTKDVPLNTYDPVPVNNNTSYNEIGNFHDEIGNSLKGNRKSANENRTSHDEMRSSDDENGTSDDDNGSSYEENRKPYFKNGKPAKKSRRMNEG